jgi:hypothetical protein
MLVFVEHNETHEPFILLGTGLGIYRSETDSLFEPVKEGVHKMLAVCDKEGKIYWYPSKELTVITVDGKNVKDHWL